MIVNFESNGSEAGTYDTNAPLNIINEQMVILGKYNPDEESCKEFVDENKLQAKIRSMGYTFNKIIDVENLDLFIEDVSSYVSDEQLSKIVSGEIK